MMAEKGLIEGLRDNYFPRVFTILNPEAWGKALKARKGGTNVSGIFKFGLQRNIDDLEFLRQAHKDKLIRLKDDPVEILREYYASAAKAMADRNFIDDILSGPVVTVEASRLGGKVRPAIYSAKEFKKLPDETKAILSDFYESVDDNFIRRIGERQGEELIRPFAAGAMVHKDIIGPLRRVMEPGMSFRATVGETLADKMMRNAVMLNAYRKRALLSFSAFHALALTESGIASVGFPFLKDGIVGAMSGRFSRQYPWMDVFDDAAKHGVHIGTVTSRDHKNVAEHLQDVWHRIRGQNSKADNRMLQVIGGPVESVAQFENLWQRKLWDHYHSGAKLFAYNELTTRALMENPLVPAEIVKKAVAGHVNNAFGGQVFEKMLGGSRYGQQAMRLLLLAPDWTLSNLAIAWDVFANMLYRGANLRARFGKGSRELQEVDSLSAKNLFRVLFKGDGVFKASDIMSSDIRAQAARRYALRAQVQMMMAANMANYAMSGKWMDQNDDGRTDHINTGWKDKSGKTIYYDFGKQFSEPFEWLESPMETFFKRKSSPILNDIASLVAQRDQYGRPIAFKEDGPLDIVGRNIGMYAKGWMPISLRNVTDLAEARNPEQVAVEALSTAGFPFKAGESQPVRRAEPGQSTGRGGRLSLPAGISTQAFRRESRNAGLPLPPGFF